MLQVHRAAIKYYGGKEGQLCAEELYHRLALNQKPETLDRRWSVEAESLLRSSIDELPLEARRYFSGKSSEGLETLLPTPSATDQLWQTARTVLTGNVYVCRIRDLLNLRHFQEARAVCEERSQRSKESPLFLAQARTLKWLGRWEEARKVLAMGIRSAEAEQIPDWC